MSRSTVHPAAMSRVALLAGTVIVVAGLALGREAFFPGFMSSDSFVQYGQSRSMRFDDWHPPIMSWLWSLLNRVSDGPEGMLHFHLALLWSGLSVWLWQYRRHALAWLLPAIGLAPWVLNFAGVLWKDAGMAFALLLLAAIAVGPPTPPRLIGAALLLFYAVNLRYNAIFAAVPVLLLMLVRWRPALSPLRLVVTTAGLLALGLWLGSLFNYQVIGAERTRPANFMMVDDLSYLSLKAKRSLIPGVPFERIQACALREISQTRLLARSFCLKHLAGLGEVDLLKADLRAPWREAVAGNKLAYLELRLAAFAFLLRSPADEPFGIWQPGVDANQMGVVQQSGAPTALVARTVEKTAAMLPFLFKPYWWLSSAVLLLAGTTMLRNEQPVRTVQALLASAILYIVGYLPITPMADFRYVYWSVIATTLAAVLLVLERPACVPVWWSRARLLAGAGAAAIVLLCLNAQGLFGIDVDRVLLASFTGAPIRVGGAPLLHQLARDANAYSITGEKPQFTLALGKAVDAAAVRHIGFNFACLDSKVRPTVRVLWWGEGQPGATDSQAGFVSGHDGLNLVRTADLPGWSGTTRLTHLRIDLFDFSACRKVKFGELALYR